MPVQDDANTNSKSNKEKLQKPNIVRQSPIEGEIPYLLKILNLTRRKPSSPNDPMEASRPESGIPEKNSTEQVSKIDQIHYDCDTYREWKDGFHRKNSNLIPPLLYGIY